MSYLLLATGSVESGGTLVIRDMARHLNGEVRVYLFSDDEFEAQLVDGQDSPFVFSAKERGDIRVSKNTTLYFKNDAPVRYAVFGGS